ncbi:5'/3'-nucleotidase SurE [Trichothermofontia sp.]
MLLLLTNDDGIDAPGLQVLQRSITGQTRVIAPNTEFSGCSHQVTTHRPIAVEQRSETAWAISGTPADCVRLGLHLLPEVHWVLAGVNPGGNLGVDIYTSGTVAAVREATFHGIPSIALSQYRKGQQPINWAIVQRWTERVLAELLNRPPAPGHFWNVNFPHLEPEDTEPEIVFCQPCTRPLQTQYVAAGSTYHYVGEYANRPVVEGTDVAHCFGGKITISQIAV